MKRISISHVVSVLALCFAAGNVGCIGQTASAGDGTTESSLDSQGSHDVGEADPLAGEFKGKTSQALELKVHATNEGNGPSPEPWETRQGPSPEPWNGHAIIVATDPKGGTKP